jgi:hypothetical protein
MQPQPSASRQDLEAKVGFSARLGVCGLVLIGHMVAIPAVANAQPFSGKTAWAARVIMAPIIAAHGGFSALCDPRAAAGATWGVNRIEKFVKITAAQRPAFDQLLAAVVAAADLKNASCPARIPTASDERLAFLEQRLESLRQAVHLVRPAFDSFYALLDDEQKRRINGASPAQWLPATGR